MMIDEIWKDGKSERVQNASLMHRGGWSGDLINVDQQFPWDSELTLE
jgi:hypothetical protein